MLAMSVVDATRRALRWLLITLVGLLLVIMTTQIVFRYGLNASLLWAEEICRYMLIWLAFLAPVFAYERGEIAAVDMLESRLPGSAGLSVAILTATASLALCLILTWYGWVFAQRAGQSTVPAFAFILESIAGEDAPAAPKRFWIYIALPVGMSLLALRLAVDIVLLARAIGTGKSPREALGRSSPEAQS